MKSKDDSRWLCKRRTMQAGRSWEEQRSCGGYSRIQIDFFFPFPVEEFTHRWVFCVDLNGADYGGGCIFAHNIWDVDHCLLSKVKCRHRSKVVTHPVSVIRSSINPSINQSPIAQAAECGQSAQASFSFHCLYNCSIINPFIMKTEQIQVMWSTHPIIPTKLKFPPLDQEGILNLCKFPA